MSLETLNWLCGTIAILIGWSFWSQFRIRRLEERLTDLESKGRRP